MTRNTLLGAEVKCLLSSLSDHGSRHLIEIETDLVQTNVLLAEAIEKLSASFMSIHEAVSAQQESMNLLLSSTPPPPEIAGQLKAKQEEIGRHVNAAVTGLQFQDMTSQLIGRTVKRVNGLRELLDEVGASGTGMPARGDKEAIVTALHEINKKLQEQHTELENGLRRAVSQTHMESGDIELF
jgi:hypothetical protein